MSGHRRMAPERNSHDAEACYTLRHAARRGSMAAAMHSMDTSTPATTIRADHKPTQFDLLGQRRFAPFFWTQFAGAANDNVLKNALVIFVAFQALSGASRDADTLVNLAGA